AIKIKKEVANAFVKRKKRSSPYEWYFEYYKSPMEQMHERCENYPPCDYLSDQIGFALAYNRFFG
ncbi:MGP protein, partial [Oriolus oriolus]|nr:MGP protein [Oriolus oriolus]